MSPEPAQLPLVPQDASAWPEEMVPTKYGLCIRRYSSVTLDRPGGLVAMGWALRARKTGEGWRVTIVLADTGEEREVAGELLMPSGLDPLDPLDPRLRYTATVECFHGTRRWWERLELGRDGKDSQR